MDYSQTHVPNEFVSVLDYLPGLHALIDHDSTPAFMCVELVFGNVPEPPAMTALASGFC